MRVLRPMHPAIDQFTMSTIRRALTALAVIVSVSGPALAQAPTLPQTLAPNTVLGRTGIGPGPVQQIPFARLLQAFAGPQTLSSPWTFSGGDQPTGAPSAIVTGCITIQVPTCGASSTWGPSAVPLDIAGLVTVDTLQGGLQINHAFGFLALYQGTGQNHNFPGWALTLNNDTTLSLYYSASAFLAPISFTGQIAANVLTVTVQGSSQPLGIGHVLSGTNVTGGTTITGQLTGTPGFTGTYSLSASSTTASETIMANPATPLVIPQQWSPNYTWLRTNCNGVLPDSIATVGYAAATAVCWNFNNVGETDFFNDPGTPGTGTFAFVWNDYNHSTHTVTQLMNIASASNTNPGAVLIGGNGVYPNPGAIGKVNVNAGANNIIETLGCSVSNTAIASYYLGCVTIMQQQDNTAGNTSTVDWRAFNSSRNSYAALIGQITDVTNNAVKGKVTIALANGASAATTIAATFNPSGGVYVGSTPSDPGANNFGVQGGINTGGAIFSNTIVGSNVYTIAGLPTCNSGTQGFRASVSNGQTSPTFLGTVSTTGAVLAPVFCNGSAWVYSYLLDPANDNLPAFMEMIG
jgi:hypothetical protein